LENGKTEESERGYPSSAHAGEQGSNNKHWRGHRIHHGKSTSCRFGVCLSMRPIHPAELLWFVVASSAILALSLGISSSCGTTLDKRNCSLKPLFYHALYHGHDDTETKPSFDETTMANFQIPRISPVRLMNVGPCCKIAPCLN
jgi:hypothetical protein